MRPLSLHVRGLLAYDDMTIDLRDIPPGLVAITGPNGEGKTSLLESLAPAPLYLEFPTRARPLKDYATRRDGLLELEESWKGHTYRHVLQIDPTFGGDRGKVEAFLFRDGLQIPEWPTPGRLADYEAAIAALFPSRSVFLASAYSAQSSKHDFFALSTAERRDLFTTLLGNAHLQEIAAKAEEGRKALDATVADLEKEIARTEALAFDLQSCEREIAGLADNVRHYEAQLGAAEIRAKRMEADRSKLAHQLEEAESRRAEWSSRRNRLAGTVSEEGTTETWLRQEIAVLTGHAAERGDLHIQVASERLRVEALAGAEADRRALEADARRANNELTAARERWNRSQAGVIAVPKIEARLAELARQQESEATYDLDAIDGMLRALRGRHTKAHAASHGDLSRIGAERARAEQDAAVLNVVPCGGRTLFGADGEPGERFECGTCPLLRTATAADARLADLARQEEAATTAAADAAALFAEIQLVETERADATTTAMARADRERRAVELRAKLTEASAAADEEPRWGAEVRRLEAEAQEIAARLTTTATATDANQARATLADLETRLRRAESAAAQLPRVEERAADALRRMDAARLELQDVEANPVPLPAELRTATTTATEQAALAHRDVETLREQAQRARDVLQATKGRAEVLREQVGGLAGIRELRQAQALRRAGFRLLERGFGRDGVQALEIDAAGPAVSEIVNDLLGATFGPRYRTALQTVRPAEGARKAREVFDMLIYDGARDPKPRRIEDVSGGERVLVSEALKCAIAMLNARRHGVEVETWWRDECDGALHDDYAALYPTMLRRAAELGGVRNVYFVTHRSAVAEQADAVIRVQGGKATVEVLR